MTSLASSCDDRQYSPQLLIHLRKGGTVRIFNKAYYVLKPVLPWYLRIALRRLRAVSTQHMCSGVWPIDTRAGTHPPGWPGWPDGKRFALVLTHDVEGKKGLARVEQLTEIELKYGFHSSFNFVPEGEYRLPCSTREMLNLRGFEVGVHGLKHDGKLYRSKTAFAANAGRINNYVRQWNASGFRSPLMQHRLGWLHALDIEYDASTFDTDPFEPESDGTGTTFPFWVSGKNNTGYVELPYTLVQDFTLFVVLRQANIDIWKHKLDWIAEHGGMALLNSHPDYMAFAGNQGRDEYPVSRYEEFLQYVREKYNDSVWAARPCDVARYYCDRVPRPCRNTRRKICMLAYTNYDVDNRVRRYAETLASAGDHVDVIALSGDLFQKAVDSVNGVTVYRIQHRRLDERHKWSYASRLMQFVVRSSWFLAKLHDRTRYDVIHIHNVPDFLVFAAWYPKLTGAKLMLDIHDLVPELFDSKFRTRLRRVYVWLLKRIERISTRFVDHVIISNHLWHETLVGRSVPIGKCSVFINHVDKAIFHRRLRTRNHDKVVIVFPGSFQRHQGLDIAVQAFALVRRKVPNAELHLYGGGEQAQNLKAMVKELGLGESVRFFDSVPLDQVADVIANADLGVVPKRADTFGNEAYSTKIMEFMSQGVPVVASRTKIDMFYFSESVVHFFKSGDSSAMADAMLEVINNAELRESLVRHGLEYVEANSWDHKKLDYLGLVDLLSTENFRNVLSSSTKAVLNGAEVAMPKAAENRVTPIRTDASSSLSTAK